MEQQPAALQFADDVLVGIFDPAALVVGRFGGELAVGADGADQLGPFAVDETALARPASTSKSTSPKAGA